MLRVRLTWAILMMTGRRGAATGESKVQWEDKGLEEWEGRWLVREGEGAGQGPGQRAEGAGVGR